MMIDAVTGNLRSQPAEGLISFYRENYYVEACCGEVKSHQNLLSCASQTMVRINVFKQCLRNVGRKDPKVVSEETVEQMLTRAKSCLTAWKGMEFKCKGPFIMPRAVDGVWVYQFGVVTEDERIVNQFVLGERILKSACLRQVVDWDGRVLLDEHAGACVKVSILHEMVIARSLMDTGASVNVMTERLWEKLEKPALLEAHPTQFAANRSQIEVIGKSSALKTTMDIKDEMYVSYVMIPTTDRDQIILGREFMMKYPVPVDLVRRETRVYLPDCGSPSLDVMQID